MKSQTLEAPIQPEVASTIASGQLSIEQREFVERLKRLYKADHQAEYLYIQAEIDSLWIQLQQARASDTKVV